MSQRPGLWVLQAPTGSIQEQYTFGKKLGEGGYGYAQLCTHIQSGEVRAVKVLPKRIVTQAQCDSMREEYEFMRSLDHPNIIKAFDAFETVENFYMVMEYCAGGELFARITEKKRYSERDAAAVMTQILEGIGYLHDNKIAHCDLKPDNFLFMTADEDAKLKIIDFGMSKRNILSYK